MTSSELSSPGVTPPTRRAATEQATTYLGPATVVRVERQDLHVTLDEADARPVVATAAFTFPYTPAAGDRLLVLGQALPSPQSASYFAVGVLSGSRPNVLAFEGDTSVQAVHGKLTLASDQAIELRAPRITVRTGLLRTLATNIIEKADHVRRWVRGTLAIRAGNSRRIVDGEDSTRCQNSTTLAKDTVKIDGDQLHLGH